MSRATLLASVLLTCPLAPPHVQHRAEIDLVSVHDLLAAVLHQVGLDHTRLTYKHNNLEESLTDARTTDAVVVGDLLKDPVWS